MDQKICYDIVFDDDDDDLAACRIIEKPCIHNIHGIQERRRLPEKYEQLSELFVTMLFSLAMLDDQEGLPIYDNICLHVKICIGRELTYDDLALMELILPEAVTNDKIYLYNPETLCMDPHLKVTVRYDVVAGHTEFSDIVALSREFDSRLFKHVDYYGEDIDVPGAELPYPFNTKQNIVIRMNSKVHSSNEELRDICQPFPEEVREYAMMDLSSSSVLRGEISSATKVCDSPKPELLKLYNKWKITDSPNLLSVDSLRKELPSVDETEVCDAFHMRPSLVKHLSAKDEESAKMELSSSLETSNLSIPRRSVGTEHNMLNSMCCQNAMKSGLLAKRFSDISITDDEVLEGESTFAAGPSSKGQN